MPDVKGSIKSGSDGDDGNVSDDPHDDDLMEMDGTGRVNTQSTGDGDKRGSVVRPADGHQIMDYPS